MPHSESSPKHVPYGSSTCDLDVLIVGAGFHGLFNLYNLRNQGYKCKIIEKQDGIGGVWRQNSYPGARVDSWVPYYEITGIETLWQGWKWDEKFPGYAELRRYFAYIDEKLDLSKDVVLDTTVTQAEFDTYEAKWRVKVNTGEEYSCKFFVLSTGISSKLYTPAFEGMELYKGTMHHTGRWPKEGLSLDGKKIAVIGSGASGVQVIQELGPTVGHLVAFQRTPNYALPMNQKKLSPAEQAEAKSNGTYKAKFEQQYKTFGGFAHDADKEGSRETAEQKKELYETLWSDKSESGFRFWIGSYKDAMFDKDVNDSIYSFWAGKTRARIHDPKKRDILAPLLENSPHPFGAKRPSLEQNYYEVFNQDNVDIVSIKANPIDTFTETGLKMTNGDEYQFDAIILATGYDFMTGGLFSMNIVGTNGKTLEQKWSNGIRSQLGMMTTNFPNLFITYGAQAPTAFANAPLLAEIQSGIIARVMAYMSTHSLGTIDPKREAEEKWTQHIQDVAAQSLFSQADSWYMAANMPGKKKEMLFYVGGLPAYVAEWTREEEHDYEGFNLA